MTDLSNAAIKAAIKAAAPGTVIHDSVVKGLQLRAFPASKSFYLFYRTKAGIQRRPKIGDWPTLTIAQAREIARQKLVLVAAGRDPEAEIDAERESPTVADLCDRYLTEYAKRKKKERSWKEDERQIKKYVKPAIGKKRVAAIEYKTIADLHDSMEKTPKQANRTVALLSKMFNLAEKWKLRPAYSNPCRHITKYPEEKRQRYMKDGEAAKIAEILARDETAYPRAVAFIYLLILTGARKGEIAAAKWEWIDGNVLRLPDSKTGRRSVFLPPQVADVLARLPKTSGTITGILDPTKYWQGVRVEAGCPDLRLHDLRHSFASAALKAGLTLAQIGELLGHKNTQTTKRYAHLAEDMAHAAVTATADVLERMMKKTGAEAPAKAAAHGEEN